MRAPWAASIAGLLFAVLFTAALVLLRSHPIVTASDEELVRLFVRGEDTAVVVGGLYLAPFAGIMFLWFVAVIRDQIGEREDRFFATVFFGAGLLFVAMLFAAAAVASMVVVGVRYMGQDAPSAALVGARAHSRTRSSSRSPPAPAGSSSSPPPRSGFGAGRSHVGRLDGLPGRGRAARGRDVLGLVHPGASGLGRGHQPVHPAPRTGALPAGLRSSRLPTPSRRVSLGWPLISSGGGSPRPRRRPRGRRAPPRLSPSGPCAASGRGPVP